MAQYKNVYEFGNTARAYSEPRRGEEYRPYGEERTRVRVTPRSQIMANIYGILFVAVAFAICAVVMVNYVQLRGNLTHEIKVVSSKQVALEEMRSQNDENYARIMRSVDLEEIEAIARGELGMSYAKEGQIITYSSADNDYMRKMNDQK